MINESSMSEQLDTFLHPRPSAPLRENFRVVEHHKLFCFCDIVGTRTLALEKKERKEKAKLPFDGFIFKSEEEIKTQAEGRIGRQSRQSITRNLRDIVDDFKHSMVAGFLLLYDQRRDSKY
jgi:hypothetical protein